MARHRPLLVAEIKTRSPFGFRSTETERVLWQLAVAYGDVVSVHTHPDWGGSLEAVRRVRESTPLPILAKGIHTTPAEIDAAKAAGADFVLTVGELYPDPHCWFEPIGLHQLHHVVSEHGLFMDLEQLVLVWNQRDLSTGLRRPPTQTQLALEMWPGPVCVASFMRTWADVPTGAAAVLVGEHLSQFVRSTWTEVPMEVGAGLHPADRARLRPAHYDTLSAQEQWAIDKDLGILDWDGR